MIKSLAKRLPHPLLLRLHYGYDLKRQSSLVGTISKRTGIPLLQNLNLSSLKSSDTVFVLGSGPSINDIPDQRWRTIGRHDSIGFNFWPVHSFIPKIYLFENIDRARAGLVYDALHSLLLRRARDYRNTSKIICTLSEPRPLEQGQMVLDLPEEFCSHLFVTFPVGVVARDEEELRKGMRYLRQHRVFDPTTHVAWHFMYGGSVFSAMSLAVRMNYRRIVLCGVDLGNAEYFYQDAQRYPETSEWEFADRKRAHLTARRLPWLVPAQQAIYCFKQEILEPAGIELFVENCSSTLFPKVPEAPKSLFDDLNTNNREIL